jgi:GNAT superfamily N-acetyltransferase
MMRLSIREVNLDDLEALQDLYRYLKPDQPLPDSEALQKLWFKIVADLNYHVFLGEIDGVAVTSCTLVVIKNITHQMRPYGLIENVVTHRDYRRQGHGTATLKLAVQCARENHCYKVMLLTGSNQEGTLQFYEQAGFNRNDKTGFVQWL